MKDIVFQWPWFLLALTGVWPFWWLLNRAKKKCHDARAKLGHSENIAIEYRDWIWIWVFVLIVFSLARPGYNPTRFSISQSGRDVVFVLDVSRSMLAQDAYPTRLEAAKQGIRDCLDGFVGEEVGLVIYAGSSSISCPLTSDYDFVRYMLSQVQPRSVEFGGTLLLSAIEKSVDQVLDPERRGFQDLIVLTDGEDHGPGIDKVAERLKESGVFLLVVGVGDSVSGSSIPILNEEGESISLKHEGQVVYTKLQDSELAELAQKTPEGEFINVGTLPFHLWEIYETFAEEKESIRSDGDTGHVVYKEASFLILPIALILSLWASGLANRGKGTLNLALLLGASLVSEPASGQEELESASFETALDWLEDGKFNDAGVAFGELAFQMERQGDSPVSLAATLFNQALANFRQAEVLGESSPREALSSALFAQNLLFQAARIRPGFKRASMRLDSLAVMMEVLEKRVAEKEKKEQERDEKIEALLEYIRTLLASQTELRRNVESVDIQRRPASRNVRSPSRDLQELPENASTYADQFEQSQKRHRSEGQAIERHMIELDNEFSMASAIAEASDGKGLETILKRPLELMGKAVRAQLEAEELLSQWRYWPAARARQSVAIDRLQQILDLFASNSDDEGEGEWDDEDWEEYMDTDPGEAVASTLPMKGEFREDSLMQPLPVPNFSAKDVLMEEMGSQQFRQEQRAKANAGKVEKDW
jgi:hypothetical protein